MTHLLSLITFTAFTWATLAQALPCPDNIEHFKPSCITHDLVHGINGAIGGAIIDGKDGAVAGAFGAMLSERLAKTLMPTQVEVTETITNAAGERVQVTKTIRPTYTPERISQVHALIHFAIGTSAFLTGMDAAQMATAVNASVIAVEHNHGDTLRRRNGGLGTIEEEEDSEQNPSKSTLTIGGKRLNTHTTAIDDGYESDTSKGLRLCCEKHKKQNDDFLAQGKKPSFLDNLRQFNAEQDYQERLEFKQGIYANQRAVKYAREHPAEVAAYAAGGTAIIASATITMPLSASLALGAGGAGLIEVGLKGGTVQSTQDLKDIGKAMILGALPSHKMKYLLPSSVVVGGLGYAFDDSTLMYGSAAIAGFSLALKGLTVAGKSVGNVIKSNPQASEIPLINASMTRHTTLPITNPAVNSNIPIKPTANTNVIPLPHVVEPIEVNGLQQLAHELSGGARTAKDYQRIYFSAERSGAQGLGSNGTLTMDGGTRTLNASKTGSGRLDLNGSGNGSDSLGVFRQNAEGRWFLSANERVSAKDLGQRPVDLKETAERTWASYQKMKAGRLNQAPYDPRAMENMLNQTYGVGNITSSTIPSLSMQNVKLAGKELCLLTDNGRGFKIVFEQKGFPIFDPHVAYDTRISFDTIKIGSRPADFKAATKQLKENILNGSVLRDLFNEMQINAIMKESRKIPDFTWHHHQDLGRMQLIPSEIHNHELMKHVGGFSMAH